jgi:hypothetical protein
MMKFPSNQPIRIRHSPNLARYEPYPSRNLLDATSMYVNSAPSAALPFPGDLARNTLIHEISPKLVTMVPSYSAPLSDVQSFGNSEQPYHQQEVFYPYIQPQYQSYYSSYYPPYAVNY